MLVNQNVVSVVFIVTFTYFDTPCLGYYLLPSHSNTSLTRKTRQTYCRANFACKPGSECIFSYNLYADSDRDCADGSDECPTNYVFRCSYDECVDSGTTCSFQQECADEDPAICGAGTTPPPVSQSPITPVSQPSLTSVAQQPLTPVSQPSLTPVSHPPITNGFCPAVNIENGKTIVLGDGYVLGSPIPNYSLVKFSCNTDYALYPNNPLVNCIDGNWNIPLPQCKPTCPPRISSSVDVTCTVDGKPVDCTKPLVDGTVAVSKCKHFYVQVHNIIPISRCSGGSWDNPLMRCEPECGEVVSEGTTNVIHGQSTKRGQFPWHIALYRKRTDKYEYQCGGSIITPVIILSAAHCFTDEYGTVRFPADEFYVGAGKYYSDYNAPDDKLAQKSQLKEYHISEGYRGYQSNFAGDLAVGVLMITLKMTNVVQPVCVDWNNVLESQQLKYNNRGTVVGWGYVDPNKQKASEELKRLNAPYIDLGHCLDVVPPSFRRWVTPDKFCAGFTNGSSVCKGDSGGGMVFDWTENNRQKYYIRGLVSVGPLQKGVCDNFQYGVYTRISFYKDFMLNIIAANPVTD